MKSTQGFRFGRDFLRGIYLDTPPIVGAVIGVSTGRVINDHINLNPSLAGLALGVVLFFWFWHRGVAARLAVERFPDFDVVEDS